MAPFNLSVLCIVLVLGQLTCQWPASIILCLVVSRKLTCTFSCSTHRLIYTSPRRTEWIHFIVGKVDGTLTIVPSLREASSLTQITSLSARLTKLRHKVLPGKAQGNQGTATGQVFHTMSIDLSCRLLGSSKSNFDTLGEQTFLGGSFRRVVPAENRMPLLRGRLDFPKPLSLGLWRTRLTPRSPNL